MNVRLSQQVNLIHLNSFGVPATATHFADISSEDQLTQLYADRRAPEKKLILGGGSNLLFVDDPEGMVVKISIPGIRHELSGTDVYVTAGGGVVWNDLVHYCVRHGFAGIENLALIPGTAGAAPIQNIGAYGVELMDVFHHCSAFDTQTGEIVPLFAHDCQFTYRDSVFKNQQKGRYIIVSITLKLSTVPSINTSYGAIQSELDKRGIKDPNIADIAAVVSSIRVRKLPDPSTIGNAGSFFKNPVIPRSLFEGMLQNHPDIIWYPLENNQVKLAAGWMIERCGWKGKRVGNCGTWKHQALVLVNHGNATGREIFSLSNTIIHNVKQHFGITLEREVMVI